MDNGLSKIMAAEAEGKLAVLTATYKRSEVDPEEA